jgi:hypothetical protein
MLASGPRSLPRAGDPIGAFVVVDEIARGGMGVVYRVKRTDVDSDQEFALKLVNDAALDEEGRARFQREMEALGRAAGHPNVIRVSTSGLDAAGRPYYVMELVAGRSLQQRLVQEGVLEADEVARVGAGLARALEHIHSHGIIHRDMKPGNILLREDDGTPILTDFGLAALQGEGQQRLTRSADILGTPVYMAPEQAQGRSVDPRSDIYGLGAVLYAAAAGRPPIPPGAQVTVLSMVANGEVTPLAESAPHLPAKLVKILERSLARLPEDRYPTAGSFARDLERFLARGATEAEAALDAGSASRLRFILPILGALLVPVAGLALIAVELAKERQLSRRVEAARALSLAADEAISRRATEAAKAIVGKKLDEAVAAWDDAPAELVKLGVPAEETARVLQGSALAAKAVEAFERRGIARLDSPARAVADLERAAALSQALGPRPDGPDQADLGLQLSAALFLAGEDARGIAALETARDSLARDPLHRVLVLARLARARIAQLDLGAAESAVAAAAGCSKDLGSEGGAARLDLALAQLELALARRDRDAVKERAEAVTRASGGGSFEAILAELETATLLGSDTAVLSKKLETLAEKDLPQLDRARAALAIAEAGLDDREDLAVSALDTAITATLEDARAGVPARGGLLRAVRCRARELLSAYRRRTGELEKSRTLAREALADATSPRWRARAELELARAEHARDDLGAASSALEAAARDDPSSPEVDHVRRVVALASIRRDFAGWPAGFRGGSGPPTDPTWETRRRAARADLGVYRAAVAEARASPRRSVKALLDIEGLGALARETNGWKNGGVRGYIEELAQTFSETVGGAVKRAMERTDSYRERALVRARRLADEAPDDPECTALAVEALLATPTAKQEDVQRLVQRLRETGEGYDASILAARCILTKLADAPGADEITTWMIHHTASHAEPYGLRGWARYLLTQKKRQTLGKAWEDVEHCFMRGSMDLSVLQYFASGLELSRDEAGSMRKFVRAAAMPVLASNDLVARSEERRHARDLLGFLSQEETFPWGPIEDRETRAVPAPMTPKKIRDAASGIGELASELWMDDDLRCQLLWLRGCGRLSSASTPGETAAALVDLAEGARRVQEKAIALFVLVDHALRATSPEELDKAFERILALPPEDQVWDHWRDVALLRGIVVAETSRASTETVPERAPAIDKLGAFLDAEPVSAAARLARSLLLASASRPGEAAADLEAALSIVPALASSPEPILPALAQGSDTADLPGMGWIDAAALKVVAGRRSDLFKTR